MEIFVTLRPTLAVFALLASTALVTPPAWALAPAATPEGAQKLMETLQTYFGKPANGEPTSLSVTPSGNEYKVTLDPSRLMKPMESLGIKIDMKPYELSVADQGDGTWWFSSSGIPGFSMKGPNGVDQQVRITNAKSEGVFDAALGIMRSGTYSVEQVAAIATTPQGTQNSSYGPLNYTMTGTARGSNAADMVMKGTLGEYSMDMNVLTTPGKPGPGTHIAIKLSKADIDAKISELHGRDALDLWAFFVAHPSKPAMAEAQADLKALLRKLLPVMQGLTETVTFKELSVDTPIGMTGAKDVGFGVDISGAVPNAHYNFSLKAASLVLPKAAVPAWAGGFVPTLVDFAPQISGMDFAAAAKEAVEDFTLNGDKIISDADAFKIVQAIAPSGSVKISLANTHIASALLDVHVDGEMNVGPAIQAGKASISATGVDAALEALKGAMGSDKNAAQAFGALSIAKGLGKPGAGGALVWAVEVTPDHKITVNGTAMGGK